MSYDAFISYAHAQDRENARAIVKLLSRLTRRWYQRRALRVFLDENEMSPNANLPLRIETAIADSKFLIYLASPAAAQSNWVGMEIEAFVATATPERIIVILTDGELAWNELNSCFDPVRSVSLNDTLLKYFRTQPLWIDVRKYANSPDKHSESDFVKKIAAVAGAIHRKSPDDIISEDLSRQRQAKFLFASLTVVLTAFLFGNIFFSYWLYVTNASLNDQIDRLELILPSFRDWDEESNSDVDEEIVSPIDSAKNALRKIFSKINSGEEVLWKTPAPETGLNCQPLFADSEVNTCKLLGADEKITPVDMNFARIFELIKDYSADKAENGDDSATNLENSDDDRAKMLEKGTDEESFVPTRQEIIEYLPVFLGKGILDSSDEDFEFRQDVNIWRGTFLRGEKDAEIILFRISHSGYCGSAGCRLLILGYICGVDECENVLAHFGADSVYLYRPKSGQMPELMIVDAKQAGSSSQYRTVNRMKLVETGYMTYLTANIEATAINE